MMDLARPQIDSDKNQEARKLAAERFRNEPDWVTFYREVLGVAGIIDQLFPSFKERSAFERTPQYAEVQQMLARLRERQRTQKQPTEPNRVITVRLPESLHEWLRHEAHNLKTSMNKLCISKLLQVVADDLVPSDFHRREPETPSGVREQQPQAPVPNDQGNTVPPASRTVPFQMADAIQPAPTQPVRRPPMTGGRPF